MFWLNNLRAPYNRIHHYPLPIPTAGPRLQSQLILYYFSRHKLILLLEAQREGHRTV